MNQLAVLTRQSLKFSLIVLALTMIAFNVSVSAHALLVKSNPEHKAELNQPPKQVVAWFSQELETKFSTMQVYSADGRQVDKGDGGVDLYDPDHDSLVVSLPNALPEGHYIVRWTVVSADDGDPTQGEFNFIVGKAQTGQFEQTPSNSSSADRNQKWPIGQMVLSSMVLLIVIIAVIIFPRVRQQG